jgi:N-acylneuraminate cytidylyltransferase
MNAVAVIPARGGSKGVFRKNVRALAGRPMIAWTIDAARGVAGIERVVVSTDDDEIASAARRAGAEVVRRPVELAGDASSSESALLHALDTLKEEDGADAEVLVFLQCTSPLTRAEDIAGALALLEEEHFDSVVAVSPNHRFLWRHNEDGEGEGINHDKAVRQLRQQRAPEYVETGAVYVMRVSGFREAGHRFFGRTGLYVMPLERCHEVDEAYDFELAERLLRKAAEAEREACLPDEIDALVLDFDGVFTDNRVLVDEGGRESVVCNRSDGMGLSRLKRVGVPVLVLSAEDNPVVEQRCRKLGVECVYGCRDKLPALRAWAVQHDVRMEHIVYVGNDVNDAACMLAVGCGAAVADARPEARAAARLLLAAKGGDCAVREMCDLIVERKTGGHHAV